MNCLYQAQIQEGAFPSSNPLRDTSTMRKLSCVTLRDYFKGAFQVYPSFLHLTNTKYMNRICYFRAFPPHPLLRRNKFQQEYKDALRFRRLYHTNECLPGMALVLSTVCTTYCVSKTGHSIVAVVLR